MAIKSKNSGAYADVVGVSVKTAGTYAAVQGIYAKSGGVYGSVLSSGASPTLTASIENDFAPLGVQFSAIGTTHPTITDTFRELVYFFDFGDGASESYTYGALAGTTKNRHIGGPLAGHMYETPGTYVARVWAWDGVAMSIAASKTITVTDPDAYFSAANTYYFHPTVKPVAGVGGVPAGVDPAQCIAQVNFKTIMETYGRNRDNTRVLLCADQVFTVGASAQGTQANNIFFGSYGGSGFYDNKGQAIIRATANSITMFGAYDTTVAQTCNNWRITNLRFESNGFSSLKAVDMGIPVFPEAGNPQSITKGYRMFHKCASDGPATGFAPYGVGSFVSASTVENANNGVSAAGFLGVFSFSVQKFTVIDTLIDNNFGSEHCLRATGAYIVETSNTYRRPSTVGKHYSTLRGWSNSVVAGPYVRGYCYYDASEQPDGSAASMCHTGMTNSSVNEPIQNVIVEGNYFNKVGQLGVASLAIDISARTTVSRGNVIDITRVATAYNPVQFGGPNVSMSQVQGDHLFVGNTIYAPNINFFSAALVQAEVDGLKAKNNLVYAPIATRSASQNAATVPNIAFTSGTFVNATVTYENNSTTAPNGGNLSNIDPLFVGPLTSRDGFKLGPTSPWAKYAAGVASSRVDAAGYTRSPDPGAIGALESTDRQVDAWSLVP